MRDIFLVFWVFVGLGFTLRYPFVGVLIWEWFSLMFPHQEAFGFSRSMPLNLCVAVVTLLSWLVSKKEPKRIPSHSIIILLFLFLAWSTLNSFFAFDPSWSWQYWDRTWRIFFFGFVVAGLATNKTRIDAIIWVAVISLLYYGIKGGVFTIETGGTFKVFGPENSIIYDNNQLALALLMILPLLEYLRTNTSSKILSMSLVASMVLTFIAVIGSYSRGAYVAMGAIAIFALFKTRRKLTYLAALAVVLVPAYYLVPQSIVDRASTIGQADTDASFHGRLVAWQVAIRYATSHFPFGAGFYGPQLHAIFNSYFPNEVAHAAHSIYFQVLGENGWIGLGLYIALALVSLWSSRRIGKSLRGTPVVWSQKLGRMIQVSLIGFFVGGAALSMAYYDLFIILVCLLPQLERLSPADLITKKRFRVATSPPVSGVNA